VRHTRLSVFLLAAGHNSLKEQIAMQIKSVECLQQSEELRRENEQRRMEESAAQH
jgi:hypothetical protein